MESIVKDLLRQGDYEKLIGLYVMVKIRERPFSWVEKVGMKATGGSAAYTASNTPATSRQVSMPQTPWTPDIDINLN